jgi:hypothetical protein
MWLVDCRELAVVLSLTAPRVSREGRVMRRYGLGSWHQEPGQKGMTVRVTEYISETDYKSIVDACDRYSALSERIAFSVMSRNRDHLLDLRDLFANLDRFGGALRYVNQRALPVTFMNELLNWLVSTRFYLETERSFATTNYGMDSEQLLKHVHATNDAFDQFPGYRFMYKLRDYAQHGGVPLSGLQNSGHSGWVLARIPL